MYCKVIDVPQNTPCNNCNPCMRMKLMELGFVYGQEIKVRERMNGMYVVDMLSDDGNVEQTIALRKEELDRICLKIHNH